MRSTTDRSSRPRVGCCSWWCCRRVAATLARAGDPSDLQPKNWAHSRGNGEDVLGERARRIEVAAALASGPNMAKRTPSRVHSGAVPASTLWSNRLGRSAPPDSIRRQTNGQRNRRNAHTTLLLRNHAISSKPAFVESAPHHYNGHGLLFADRSGWPARRRIQVQALPAQVRQKDQRRCSGAKQRRRRRGRAIERTSRRCGGSK